jgi:hypothetical protein
VADTFTPPAGVRAEARRALKWIEEGHAGQGFTDVGRKRASDLARGASVSLKTVKRMKSYLSRHQVDKQGQGWSQGADGYPSPGRVAWAAWGGDAARSWVNGILDGMEKAVDANEELEDDLTLVEMWMEGEIGYEELPEHVRDAISDAADDLEDAPADDDEVLMVDVEEPAEKTSEPLADTELIHKADGEHRFTLGPWYIPNRYDAHGEWTDADELQKALWEYVRTGDRDIRLQHNRDIVAGEWLEAMSFPVPVTIGMQKSGEAKQVTYPSGTVFLGVQWKPWAWDMVKEGKIRGFSIGGAAARIEMSMPEEALKATFGSRSEAGRYAANMRWRGQGAARGTIRGLATNVMARRAEMLRRAIEREKSGEKRASLLERMRLYFTEDIESIEPIMAREMRQRRERRRADQSRVDSVSMDTLRLPSGRVVTINQGQIKTLPFKDDQMVGPGMNMPSMRSPRGGVKTGRRSSQWIGTGGPRAALVGKSVEQIKAEMRVEARVREALEKQQPTSGQVHVDAIMNNRRKRRRKQQPIMVDKAEGGLTQWFKEDWVDISRPKEGGGFEPCGRPDAEDGKYPKCVPASVAAKMSDKERKSAVRRKRRAEADEKREDKKPIYVETFKAESKNVPVDAELYARVKAEAKRKFDVYPSAYANAWLVQEYKRRGGKYKVDKAKSFGGDRSEAGRYAATIRWMGHNALKISGRGSFPKPKTAAGKRLAKAAPSLSTHCDLDAAAAELKSLGLTHDAVNAPAVFAKYLTPERSAVWRDLISNRLDNVPRSDNPEGSRVYVKAGGGGSGKSSSGDVGVFVPTTGEEVNGEPTARNAVFSNSDEEKVLHPSWDKLADGAGMQEYRASFVHEESSMIAGLTVGMAIIQGKDLVIDGTFDNGLEKAEQKIDSYWREGAAEVNLIVYSCDTSEAQRRATARAAKSGRTVPAKALRTAHVKVSTNFPSYMEWAQSGKFNSVAVIDTNLDDDPMAQRTVQERMRPPQKVYEFTPSGGIKVLNQVLYQRFLDKRNDPIEVLNEQGVTIDEPWKVGR